MYFHIKPTLIDLPIGAGERSLLFDAEIQMTANDIRKRVVESKIYLLKLKCRHMYRHLLETAALKNMMFQAYWAWWDSIDLEFYPILPSFNE